MRRKDREMPKDFALAIVDKCEYAVLAVTDFSGSPYCLPVTIVRNKDAIYFHSAPQGLKADCLRKNPRVCLTCVGSTHIVEEKFTTEYESAIIRGNASEIQSDEEKTEALRLLCLRHAPSNMAAFDKAIDKSLGRTSIWKISMDEITGKRKKYDSEGKEMKFGRME